MAVTKKLFAIPDSITPQNFEQAMDQAIALELATIPTYLATYYSIERAPDQDQVYEKLKAQLQAGGSVSPDQIESVAQELKTDVLVYANKTAALIMSVVIEEMLHLALSSNVKSAICQKGPNLLATAASPAFQFPTMLDGHEPEFMINLAKLSPEQLGMFLQIESPNPYRDPADFPAKNDGAIKYKTIGLFYQAIMDCVEKHFPGPYAARPQLLPPEPDMPPRPYYSQNSVNTLFFDENHTPHFTSEEDSGELIGVIDAASALAAMHEICEQGEGNSADPHHLLRFDEDNQPIPFPVVDGKVRFEPGDYDDPDRTELSHFAKFMEAYSLGGYYRNKFAQYEGLDDFFSYFVADTRKNPKGADYFRGKGANSEEIGLMNELGSALFTYILLMVETCYYSDESTQFRVFMYGIHKTMIWLLSDLGNAMRRYTFTAASGESYTPSLSFEAYDFAASNSSPKDQIIGIAQRLINATTPTEPGRGERASSWKWLLDDTYLPGLPDVSLDHVVTPNVPKIPARA